MYYARVRITKVKKHYKTPLISYINEKGVRCWDDTQAAGKAIYVDKIGLEGMVQFHGMEYEIMAGYYYNEGFNSKVCEVIEKLFQEVRAFRLLQLSFIVNNMALHLVN